MLAKNNSMQQPNRRTPLSLGSSMKPSKSNDNNKKETNSNQKTENQKKDSQMERKLSADQKKQSTTDTKRSSTSSADSRKQDDNKSTKNEDNKKNQNGVNGSGSNNKQSNKQNSNEVMAKIKSEPAATSNGSSASNKKESQKQAEKKKDPAVVVDLIAKTDNNKESIGDKTKETKESKEAKNEENKNKASDKNEEKKATEVSNSQNLDQDKAKEKKGSEMAAEKKNTEEKANEVQSEEKPTAIEHEVTMVVSDTVEEQATKTEEVPSVPKTPIKENRAEEPPKEDIAMLDNASEDIEMMESLKYIEDQPPTSSNVFAVSTPAKNCSPKEALNFFEVPSQRSPKSEIKTPKETLTYTPDRKSCPRTFSSISGRRSIRPIGDYTFSGNLQIRESYRKINTELDFTTSSMNVTVGSEVPNNESFSFFSRSRKRDRSSPSHPSAMEVQNDISPKSPKRARVDLTGGGAMYGFFNAMASPITMLRNRLARASVQSTPKKLIVDQIEQDIVENVSAIAVEAIDEELTATEEQMLNPDSTVADADTDTNEQPQPEEPAKCSQQNPDLPGQAAEAIDDIKIKETITATDSQAKKRCSIM